MSRRKQKIYGCGVAVVALGLLLDRWIGSGDPGPALVQGAPAASARHAPRSPPGEVGSDRSLRAYLLSPARFPIRGPGGGVRTRDLFEPTQTARDALSGGTDPPEGEVGAAPFGAKNPPATRAALAEQFKAGHRVTAVVSGEAFGMAFVDGAWAEIGQTFDGCTLARLKGQTAVFDCQGKEVELSVTPESPTAGGG